MNIVEYYNTDSIEFINNVDNIKKSLDVLYNLFDINDIDVERDLKFKEIIQQLKQDEELDWYDPNRYSIIKNNDFEDYLLDSKLWILNIDIVCELDYGTYVYLFLTYNSLFNNYVAWYFSYRKSVTFKQDVNILINRIKGNSQVVGLKKSKELFLSSFIEFYFDEYLRREE